MDQDWRVAAALVEFPQLADLLGGGHRIISNDSQAAAMSSLAGRSIRWAVDLLAQVDFSPPALLEDLAGDRITASYLNAASELLDYAADPLAESATLAHENDRRWRVFGQRIRELRSGVSEGSGAS